MLKAMRKGTLSREEMILKPNDIVYVPRTFMADLTRFLSEDIDPILDTFGSAVNLFDFRDRVRNLYKHYYQ